MKGGGETAGAAERTVAVDCRWELREDRVANYHRSHELQDSEEAKRHPQVEWETC